MPSKDFLKFKRTLSQGMMRLDFIVSADSDQFSFGFVMEIIGNPVEEVIRTIADDMFTICENIFQSRRGIFGQHRRPAGHRFKQSQVHRRKEVLIQHETASVVNVSRFIRR